MKLSHAPHSPMVIWPSFIALVEQLRSQGFEVPDRGRLISYSHAVIRVANEIQSLGRLSQQAMDCMAYSGLELLEINLILEELGSDKAWWPAIHDLFSGHTDPRADKNAHARNLQAELFSAAMLKRAGWKVKQQEPDFTANVNGWHLGFAVKRVRSEQKLVSRIVEGFDQLKTARYPGIVIAHVTELIHPSGMVTRGKSLAATAIDRCTHLADIASQACTTIRHRIDGDYALGFWLFARGLNSWIKDYPGTAHMRHYRWLVGDGDPRIARLKRLSRSVAAVTGPTTAKCLDSEALKKLLEMTNEVGNATALDLRIVSGSGGDLAAFRQWKQDNLFDA